MDTTWNLQLVSITNTYIYMRQRLIELVSGMVLGSEYDVARLVSVNRGYGCPRHIHLLTIL